MEVFDKDIQFLKDIWSDDDQREATKRVIAIAIGRAKPDVSIGTLMEMDAVLDDMLLSQEAEPRLQDKNMTI